MKFLNRLLGAKSPAVSVPEEGMKPFNPRVGLSEQSVSEELANSSKETNLSGIESSSEMAPAAEQNPIPANNALHTDSETPVISEGPAAKSVADYLEEPAVPAADTVVKSEPTAVPYQSADDVREELVSAELSPSTQPEVAMVKPSKKELLLQKFKGISQRLTNRRASRPKYASVPIRVIIGYLPEVTERDAREFAIGVAEKHFEQIGMAYFQCYEYDRGFVYEVHEGGDGRGFVPEITKYFKAQGPYKTGETVIAIIKTATRMVEVQRLRDGLAALVLPEGSEATQSTWLEPSEKMIQALNRRTGFLVAGATMFITGFTAMLVTALLARYQSYDPPPPVAKEYVNAQMLPIMQWSRVEGVMSPNYVKAIRFKDGKWQEPEIGTDSPELVNPTEPAAVDNSVPSVPAPPPAQVPAR